MFTPRDGHYLVLRASVSKTQRHFVRRLQQEGADYRSLEFGQDVVSKYLKDSLMHAKCFGNLQNGYPCVFIYHWLYTSGHLFVWFSRVLSFNPSVFTARIKMFYRAVHRCIGWAEAGHAFCRSAIMTEADLSSTTLTVMKKRKSEYENIKSERPFLVQCP